MTLPISLILTINPTRFSLGFANELIIRLVLKVRARGGVQIDVNKGSLDLRELLELMLEGLADVVSLCERRVVWEHNANLHEVTGAKQVGPHSVDARDPLVVVPYQIRQLR